VEDCCGEAVNGAIKSHCEWLVRRDSHSVNGILESWIIGIRGLVNGGSERYLEREKGLEHRRLWYRLLDCR